MLWQRKLMHCSLYCKPCCQVPPTPRICPRDVLFGARRRCHRHQCCSATRWSTASHTWGAPPTQPSTWPCQLCHSQHSQVTTGMVIASRTGAETPTATHHHCPDCCWISPRAARISATATLRPNFPHLEHQSRCLRAAAAPVTWRNKVLDPEFGCHLHHSMHVADPRVSVCCQSPRQGVQHQRLLSGCNQAAAPPCHPILSLARSNPVQ
mmetsp:Transcript_4802/g.9400  ORF Transcript_4802/g.9400 Transcript_4802/m.9400 type:complete len:209 (+) Transcript_4802:140-766(+)